MGGRLRGRRTVRVAEAWLGCSGARHRFLGQARWMGGPWEAVAVVEDGPGRGRGRTKGLLQPMRWTLSRAAPNVRYGETQRPTQRTESLQNKHAQLIKHDINIK